MVITASLFLQEEEDMSKRTAPDDAEQPEAKCVPYEQHVTTELRKYQARICNRSRAGNHIIVLPTGAGEKLALCLVLKIPDLACR
jgi:superfamily II DNA or RNA helicase